MSGYHCAIIPAIIQILTILNISLFSFILLLGQNQGWNQQHSLDYFLPNPTYSRETLRKLIFSTFMILASCSSYSKYTYIMSDASNLVQVIIFLLNNPKDKDIVPMPGDSRLLKKSGTLPKYESNLLPEHLPRVLDHLNSTVHLTPSRYTS